MAISWSCGYRWSSW